jgi:hypothetical protein
MRQDIEAMRQEARRRLENLAMDLEEFKFNKAASAYLGSKEASSVSLSSMEGTRVDTNPVASSISAQRTAKSSSNVGKDTKLSSSSKKVETKILVPKEEPPEIMILHQPVDVHLLENTRVCGMSTLFVCVCACVCVLAYTIVLTFSKHDF